MSDANVSEFNWLASVRSDALSLGTKNSLYSVVLQWVVPWNLPLLVARKAKVILSVIQFST